MNESTMWRAKPPTSYRASGRITRVPESALHATIQALRTAGDVESACFWLGKLDASGNGVVAAVIIPKQLNHAQNYEVTGGAMLEVAAIARPQNLTIVGAVHSHPGRGVEHSRYDDHMTPSRRALSIVFPHFGRWSGPWARGVGVHEYIDKYWHLLPEKDAHRRIAFSDELSVKVVDLR